MTKPLVETQGIRQNVHKEQWISIGYETLMATGIYWMSWPQILPSMRCGGVYIIWYFDESHAPQTVRVGIKGVNNHLGIMRKDPEVEKHAEHPLYITWAEVKPSSLAYLEKVWSYLYKELEPLVGPPCPQVDATRVVLPWTPIKEASGASGSKTPHRIR